MLSTVFAFCVFSDTRVNTFLIMKGDVPNDKITASSFYNANTMGFKCKMNSGKAWCPSSADENMYLQIDFVVTKRLTAVVTKGHFDFFSWTKTYSLNSTFDLLTWNVIESNGEKVFRYSN